MEIGGRERRGVLSQHPGEARALPEHPPGLLRGLRLPRTPLRLCGPRAVRSASAGSGLPS